jgi:ABC-type spermidine/putrescine transport system permease subunit II
MGAVNPSEKIGKVVQIIILCGLYIFLYFPILYLVYLSFMENPIWPFPPKFTLEWYHRVQIMSDIHVGLINSMIIGLGTGVVSAVLASFAAVGMLRYTVRGRWLYMVIYLSPLFVAHVLIGIAQLMFNRSVLDIPANLWSAILGNATYGISFAFLVLVAQLVKYNWQLDEAAQVFGASPIRCFWEVTLPSIWPAILGAFVVSFLLAFNDFTITFYNVGAVPTMPTVAWGSMRHGMEKELFALAALVNALVFLGLGLLYVLLRTGLLRLGIPED